MDWAWPTLIFHVLCIVPMCSWCMDLGMAAIAISCILLLVEWVIVLGVGACHPMFFRDYVVNVFYVFPCVPCGLAMGVSMVHIAFICTLYCVSGQLMYGFGHGCHSCVMHVGVVPMGNCARGGCMHPMLFHVLCMMPVGSWCIEYWLHVVIMCFNVLWMMMMILEMVHAILDYIKKTIILKINAAKNCAMSWFTYQIKI